jgi:hypothetical protein
MPFTGGEIANFMAKLSESTACSLTRKERVSIAHTLLGVKWQLQQRAGLQKPTRPGVESKGLTQADIVDALHPVAACYPLPLTLPCEGALCPCIVT